MTIRQTVVYVFLHRGTKIQTELHIETKIQAKPNRTRPSCIPNLCPQTFKNFSLCHRPQGMHTTVTTYFYSLAIPFIIDVTNSCFIIRQSTTLLMLATQISGDTSPHTKVVGIICRTIGVGDGPRIEGDI